MRVPHAHRPTLKPSGHACFIDSKRKETGTQMHPQLGMAFIKLKLWSDGVISVVSSSSLDVSDDLLIMERMNKSHRILIPWLGMFWLMLHFSYPRSPLCINQKFQPLYLGTNEFFSICKSAESLDLRDKDGMEQTRKKALCM